MSPQSKQHGINIPFESFPGTAMSDVIFYLEQEQESILLSMSAIMKSICTIKNQGSSY